MTDYLRDFQPDVFHCDICEEVYETEDCNQYEYGDELICEYCLDEHFIVCDYCGKVIDKDAESEVCPGCGSGLKKESA